MKYISFIGLLAIALLMLPDTAMTAGEVEIVLEAELADEITAPMVIAVPMDAKDAGGNETDEPSNGKYVWAPGAPVTGGGGSGYVRFIIDIPEEDTYAIWGHVIAWDGNSDSLWVTWTYNDPPDGADEELLGDPIENPQQTQNTEYRWGVGGAQLWTWDRVNHWLNGGTFDREWEFMEGETTLTFWSREDATMLDAIYITNEIADGDANKRLPDDDDRQLQIEGGTGKAVKSVGKLSTTWGGVKSRYNR